MLTWGSTSIGIKQAVGARLWDGLISTHDMRYQRAKTVCLQWLHLWACCRSTPCMYGIVLSELCPFTLSLLSPFREETWVWYLCQGCPAPIDVATSIIAVMPDGCGPRITQLPRSCQGQLLGPSLPQALEIHLEFIKTLPSLHCCARAMSDTLPTFGKGEKSSRRLCPGPPGPLRVQKPYEWNCSVDSLYKKAKLEVLHDPASTNASTGPLTQDQPLPSTSHSHSTSKQAASLAGSSTPIQNTTPVYQRIQFYQISNRGIAGRRSYRSCRATSLKLQRTIKRIRNPPEALTLYFFWREAKAQSQEEY